MSLGDQSDSLSRSVHSSAQGIVASLRLVLTHINPKQMEGGNESDAARLIRTVSS